MSNRFEIGRFSCAVIDNGPTETYAATSFIVNAPEDEAAEILGGTEIVTGLNCLLVRAGDAVVLMDTGMGSLLPGGTDRMRERLSAEGLTPDEVTLVITSHAHPDHIGGHTIEGRPAFPRAKYLFSKVEWDHFVVNGTGVEMFDQVASMLLPPLEAAGVVEWLGSGEILPGLEVVEAPGHTPGHVAIAISDGGKRAMYAADSFLYTRHPERPELYSAFDWDGPKSVESRKSLLDRAAADGAVLVLYHLDPPGIGRVARAGNAWRWTPGVG